MEGAFTHVGNHLISDSAAAINGDVDELSALGVVGDDGNIAYGTHEPVGVRRTDDNDNQTERVFDDDKDSESSENALMLSRLNLQEAEEPESLPEHACAYCGNHNPGCVVKCLICSKWFCNARGSGNSTHIINHLVKARHKEVQLHPDSSLGDTVLECYNCGIKNVFLLGFIPAKSDAVVVLICRQPCAVTTSKDMTWDVSRWQPLISEKAFLSWLVEHPSAEEMLHARHITPSTMARLEETWKTNPAADVFQVQAAADVEEEPQPVLLRYEDAVHYQNIFAPLVKMESDYDRKMKEEQSEDDLHVTWTQGVSNTFASFNLRKIESGDVKLAVGDEMRLRYHGGLRKPWEGVGYVVKIPNNQSDQVTLELRKAGNDKDFPEDNTTGFSADYVWKATSYDRMQLAMKTLVLDSKAMDSFIFSTLIGMPPQNAQPLRTSLPKKWSAPGLPDLNPSQVQAIRSVLQNRLSLIQGPPGTGKTVTSATIIYHLTKITKSQVLVCAPSNVAVDQLCERVHRTGLKVVRLTAKSREDVESSVSFLALHQQVEKAAHEDIRRYNKLREELGELKTEDEKRYKGLIKRAEREILSNADVVCCTCVGAGDPRLSKMKFRNVLIDESTQSAEPECLIPLVLGSRQVILVGDHKQLGPVIMNKKAAKAGLNQSMFERLVNLHQVPIRLNIQYRMHPCLSEFPSNMFYDGTLQNGVTHESRIRKDIDFPWPVAEMPMMFWTNLGVEEISPSGTSFLNRTEAQNVEKTVTRLFKAGVKPSEIGVITPYEGQRSYIVSTMQNAGSMKKDLYKMVEVASVDAFQGREKDFIVLSCVRSNEASDIGFLSDPRRLNVGLTRAKYGVVILGNPKALSKHELWHNLLTHFKDRKCFVQGPLTHLQPCMLQFGRPRPSHRPKHQGSQYGYNGPGASRFGRDFDSRSTVSYDYRSNMSYVPDDASSIHSSQFGGASLNGYSTMFSNFAPEHWPGLPGASAGHRGNRGRARGPESVAGESVANSEYTDTTSSVIGGKGVGQGGASLGAGLHDAVTGMRPVSYTQSDRLKHYVENSSRMGPGNPYGRRYDDDEKSVSTAFHSQIGGGYS